MPIKPSDQENDSFAKRDLERRKQPLAEHQRFTQDDRPQEETATVPYRCPKCGADLVTASYKEVEIDKCSGCLGIWLDCGELEHVLESDVGFLGAIKRIFT